MPTNLANLNPRKPGKKPAESDILALEQREEEKSHSVAGQEIENAQSQEPQKESAKRGTIQNPYVRKDGTKTHSTSIHLPVELSKKLSIHCIDTRQSRSEVITKALEQHLNS